MQLKERNVTPNQNPQKHGVESGGVDSEDESNKELAQQVTADNQEVQKNELEPDVSDQFQDTSPAEASIPSDEPHDARPRLEQAERSENQEQLPQPEPQERKMQNVLA